jgi:hypothetical protein
MSLYMGLAAYFSAHIFRNPQLAETVARLCLDRRWPWALANVSFGLRSSFFKATRRQRLSGRAAADKLRYGLLNADHRNARLGHSADEEENHARLEVETGQRLAQPDIPYAATIVGRIKAFELPDGATPLNWVDVMHELMVALDVGNGVLPVWPTVNMVDSDSMFVRIILDTPKADYNLGVRGEFETQCARANYWRPELGDKYVRHPRWGTYLRRNHIDRVGGLARLRDTVPLAKIVELGGAGDLIYLQCTDQPKGALTPAGESVRQALQTFLEPILCPPRPQEQAAP